MFVDPGDQELKAEKIGQQHHHHSRTLQIPKWQNVRKFFYSILLFRVNDPIKWFFFLFRYTFLLLLLSVTVSNVIHEKFMQFL